MPSGWLSICPSPLLGQVDQDLRLAELAGCQDGVGQDAVLLALADEQLLAARPQDDAVGEGQAARRRCA